MEFITVRDFVQEILNSVPKPWGSDIVDRVFVAIENNPEWLATFEQLVRAHGQYPVENSIGLNILTQTGMKNTDRVKPARSQLIKNYSELE